MKRVILPFALWLCWATGASGAEHGEVLSDEASRIGYSLGYQMGGDLERNGVALNAETLTRGIEDARNGADSLMSEEAMEELLGQFKRQLIAEHQNRQQQRAAKMRRAGLKFLEQNKDKEGVKTLPSGLQYKIIEQGAGKSPGPEDKVTVNYRGTLISGQVFDSSYARGEPASFRLDQVIKGWSEGLQLMKEGGKHELFIPPELAYDKQGPMADHTLIFEVELLSVGEPQAAAEAGTAAVHEDPATKQESATP